MKTLQRNITRVARRMTSARISTLLWTLNATCRKPVVDSTSRVVVSLTTHGRRIKTVALTIESIARGQVKPGRLILYVAPGAGANKVPALERLMDRGLEILEVEDVGPHTKYYPYVTAKAVHDVPLVTADDDVLYPRQWLSTLAIGGERAPDNINCHRARRLVLDGHVLAPYAQWPVVTTTRPSSRHIALGVAGVWYPPAFLSRLQKSGLEFLSTSPRADDLWLHRCAVLWGFRVSQLFATAADFPTIYRGQELGLLHGNVLAGGNDEQKKATHDAEVLSILMREQEVPRT